jgi:hypothetical protein
MSQASIALPVEELLRIARLDAEVAYRDLSPFEIRIKMEADGWHIDYEFTQPGINGGGPHYVIHPVNGSIVSKRYEQ